MRLIHATALLATTLGTAHGLAQNALGDGRALDGGLNTLGRFNDSRPDFYQELQFRNAIVTGNAANGLSFRGDVGYTAAGDFRGALGSNDLFAFRRDALTSGLAGAGIRGTDALQFQMALTTGSRPPRDLIGGYALNQSGAGVSSRQLTAGPGQNITSSGLLTGAGQPDAPGTVMNRPAGDPNADDRGQLLWSLRSTSVNVANRGLQPAYLGQTAVTSATETPGILTASTLRGVRLTTLADLTSELATPAAPRSAAEVAAEDRAEAAATKGIAPSYQTLFDRAIADFEARAGAAGAPAEDGAADTKRALRVEQQELRGYLQGSRLLPGDADAEETDNADGADAGPGVNPQARSVELLRAMRDQREKLLEEVNAGRDVYAEHMSAGQALLAEGRYFDAEKRFAGALSIRNADPTALIGRLHAQIGGGLYVSAAINLKELFYSHPELVGVRYGPELLPSPQRWADIRTSLGSVVNTGDGAGTLAHDGALVLAYLAYQMGDAAGWSAALDRFEASAPGAATEPGAAGFDARLATLLRQVWAEAPTPPPVEGGR